MNDYQFIHFLAIDHRLNEDQLGFMDRQSSYAIFDELEFSHESPPDDFHGDPLEMLRQGYHAHLHYANSGLRRLMFRLPGGLLWGRKVLDPFLNVPGVHWHPDPGERSAVGGRRSGVGDQGSEVGGQGPEVGVQMSEGWGRALEEEWRWRAAEDAEDSGSIASFVAKRKRQLAGTLEISPEGGGPYEKEIRHPERLLVKLVPVRYMLSWGDLRPLYLAWLRLNRDEHALEPPVPAGLGKLTRSLKTLAKFYEVPRELIAAAAEQSPAVPEPTARQRHDAWLARPEHADFAKLLKRLYALIRKVSAEGPPRNPAPELVRELDDMRAGVDLHAMRKAFASMMLELPFPSWPMAEPTRSLAQLRELAARKKKETEK
jgi:hypothetical protein